MNVIEMHLAVQQGVDKINSLQADMLLPEEIDIELNKSVSRFINNKYGKNNIFAKGFEESQKRIDDLRNLVTEYTNSVVYKEQHNETIFIDKFKLPSDYLYLVNQKSEILINGRGCDPVGWSLDNNSETYYVVVPFTSLHLNPSTNTSTSFIAGMSLMQDETDWSLGFVNIPSAGASFWSSYSYPADIDLIRLDLLNSGNWPAGVEIYWETYGDLNYADSFIFIVDINIHTWFNWDASNPVDSGNTSAVSEIATIYSSNLIDIQSTHNFAQYSNDVFGSKRIVGEEGYNRRTTFNKFVQHDDIYKLLDDPFNTTKPSAPLTTMQGDYIDIYTSDIFIIDKVKITYIRKPKQISLSLGINCELPIHTHQEIVDRTVGSILEGINDPRYQGHQKEVANNE
jgi:hypothetical protein